VQRLYPGDDPIDNIKESEFHNKRLFLEANDEMIFLREKEENKDDIEDSLNMADLYDEKADNASQGKCCRRITYEEFPAGNSLKTIIPAVPDTTSHSHSHGHGKAAKHHASSNAAKAAKASVKAAACHTGAKVSPAAKANPVFAPSVSRKAERKMQNPEKEANFCILLFVPDEARWRVCHESQDDISKLQLKIVYSVLKSKAPVKAGLMEKFLSEIKVGAFEDIPNWSWENQDKWGGKCQSTVMQSPINLAHKEAVHTDSHFGISMHLSDVHTLVKKNFNEVIVTFLNFAGVLKLTVDSTYILYTPQFMSFRFPGETIINGKRSHGDILIHFAELSSERKTATTNGLVLQIPIEADNSKESVNLDNIDQLNMEFWRFEVLKHGTYIPKKFFKKNLLKFSLEEFSNKFMAMNPNFMMYYGSSTTPPCNQNVMYIVVDKPIKIPGCQFKLLRENSLVSAKPKEIHTRVERPSNDRVVYQFDKKKFGYIPSVVGLVPQSFNKYLLAHGPSYMAKMYLKYGKKGKGGKFHRWFVKHGHKFSFAKKPWWAKKQAAAKRAAIKAGVPMGGDEGMDCSVPAN